MIAIDWRGPGALVGQAHVRLDAQPDPRPLKNYVRQPAGPTHRPFVLHDDREAVGAPRNIADARLLAVGAENGIEPSLSRTIIQSSWKLLDGETERIRRAAAREVAQHDTAHGSCSVPRGTTARVVCPVRSASPRGRMIVACVGSNRLRAPCAATWLHHLLPRYAAGGLIGPNAGPAPALPYRSYRAILVANLTSSREV